MLVRFTSPFSHFHFDPLVDLVAVQNQMNRLLSDFNVGPGVGLGTRYPQMDMIDSKEELTLIAELPGVSKGDIKIILDKGQLTISGERKSEKAPEDAEWLRKERSFGQFSRTFDLPAPVQSDKISAEFKNGILRVTLPKREDAKPREIQIKVG